MTQVGVEDGGLLSIRRTGKADVDVASGIILVGGQCTLCVTLRDGQIKTRLLSGFHQVILLVLDTEPYTRFQVKRDARNADPLELSPATLTPDIIPYEVHIKDTQTRMFLHESLCETVRRRPLFRKHEQMTTEEAKLPALRKPRDW